MEHLGKVFREFRTSGNYSLKEAAGESCSTSQLSRFELGESDLAVSRFFEILDNIHVTIENFMDKARDFQNHEHVSMMAQIIPLYYSNDIVGFQKLQEEQLEKAKSSTTPQAQSEITERLNRTPLPPPLKNNFHLSEIHEILFQDVPFYTCSDNSSHSSIASS